MLIGIVLLFLNNFYWFQLNRTLGPIATTLMRVIHDVLKVAFAYLIFLVAFGTGIHLVLNNAVYGYEKCDDDDVRIDILMVLALTTGCLIGIQQIR